MSTTASPGGLVGELAAWRASLCHALALAFSYPTASTVDDLAVELEDLAAHALTDSAGLTAAVTSLRDALAGSPLEDLAAVHNRLFAGEVPCSPCETEYEFDAFAKARQLADIAGFYRAFGLKTAAAEAAPADFIATELEFCAHLLVKEAWAASNGWDDRARVAREAHKSFVEDHLGRWVPTFCRALVSSEDVDAFFGAAACLCDGVVAREIANTGARPRPAAPRHRPPDQAETFTCPFATASAGNEEDEP